MAFITHDHHDVTSFGTTADDNWLGRVKAAAMLPVVLFMIAFRPGLFDAED